MLASKIFGVGLPRTGTRSLTAALGILGFRTAHYFTDSRWIRGDFSREILAEIDAVTDTPVPVYFPALDRQFPGSKFILTVRDSPSWVDSIRRHQRETLGDPPSDRERAAYRLLTYGIQEFNEHRHRYVLETHQQNVRWYFRDRPEDLLVMDICGGEGWERLCPFLGKAIPRKPFPNEKDSSTS